MAARNRILAILRVLLAKVIPAIIGLVVLVLVIAWLSGAFAEKIPPGQQTATPRLLGDEPTTTVHEITQEHHEEAVGTLKAAARTVISSRVLAQIEEMTVTAGDQVKEGQLLVRLSSAELDARLRQAEQALVAATAVREEAERALQRAVDLGQRSPGSITAAEFDELNARVQITRAEELRQRQAVEEAVVLLSYTEIHAPVDGRIVDRLAEPGDTVTPGLHLLVLYDATSLRLEAPVGERLAVNLEPGQQLKVHIDSRNLDLIGQADVVVPQAETGSRSLLVKITLPPSDDLLEGLFGRVEIPAGERVHYCLASAAVRRVGQLEFVDVVVKDPDRNPALERRLIKTGRLGYPGWVEVLSGLEPGEEVVLYGEAPLPIPVDDAASPGRPAPSVPTDA